MRARSFALVVLSLICIAACDVVAAPPTTVPALITGSASPRSFLVRGVFWFSRDSGLAFHVATDGPRQLCAVYDAVDGTPVFLSDERQTLMYDLVNTRIVRLPNSRAKVQVDCDPAATQSLKFNVGADYSPNAAKLEDCKSWFRIDRFVNEAGPALKRVESPDNMERFAMTRPNGSVVVIEKIVGDASEFRLTGQGKDRDYHDLDIEATHIGRDLPESFLAFPDLKQLAQSAPVMDADERTLTATLSSLQSGLAWAPKIALSFEKMRDTLAKAMPNVDWDELRRRDALLGAQYRAALAQQHISFPIRLGGAATQPVR